MNRLNSLHNKTQEVKEDELPYNPSNKLLQKEDLRTFFNQNGLKDATFHNINLYDKIDSWSGRLLLSRS